MVIFVKTNGFDGMAEMQKNRITMSFLNYVAYFNAATVAMHSIGKQLLYTSVISYMPQGIGASLLAK